MGLDTSLSLFAYQLAWTLPTCLTVVVIAAVAIVRRDAGVWWKLVVAGAAVLLVGQVINVVGTVALYQAELYRVQWVVSLASVVLNVIALALIGAGAVVGRGRKAAR